MKQKHVNNYQEVVDLFADHFSSVYEPNNGNEKLYLNLYMQM